jgi:hypothetical protein
VNALVNDHGQENSPDLWLKPVDGEQHPGVFPPQATKKRERKVKENNMNSQSERSTPSSNGHHEMHDENHHPLDNVVAAAPHTGTILEMQTGLFELGRNRGLQSGTTVSLPADVQALEDHARAMARDTYRDRFDPKLHAQDAMHQTEYERSLNQREEEEKGEAHAAANLRDAEIKLAQTAKAGEKPTANGLLVAAFIVAITITVAPTLHDFVFHTMADDLLAWFGASITAAFIALMLTLAILSGRRTSLSWLGVVAGVVLGIGLGAVRFSSAEGTADVLFAIGLTIVEIASVILLEWLASGLRNSENYWAGVKATEDKALSCRDAAQLDLSRRQARVKEIGHKIDQKIALVQERQDRNIHLPELEAVAAKAVCDGYNAGINENIGRLRSAAGRTI